jgi:hypothetical protein
MADSVCAPAIVVDPSALDMATPACVCFEVICHVPAQADIDSTGSSIVEDNMVEFAAVAIKFLAVGYFLVPVLGRNVGAVPVTEDDAFALMINGIQLCFNVLPALEYAP